MSGGLSAADAVMKPIAKYVVYDPPVRGFPYLAVLFRPDMPPRVFQFQTFDAAKQFLTAQAQAVDRSQEKSPEQASS
jgi:hypothetical protein